MMAFDDLEKLAKRARLSKNPTIQRYLHNPLIPPKERQKIRKFLAYAAMKESPLDHPLAPGPSREEAGRGDLSIEARVVTGKGPEYEYRYDSNSLLGASGICGPTGAGKSITLFLLSLAVHLLGCPVHWFDSEGDLIAFATAAYPDIMIIRPSMFRQDIFMGPPGIDFNWREYLSKFVSTFQETIFIRDGGENMSREIAIDLRKKQKHFTLAEFYEALLRLKFGLNFRERQYWDTLRNRIGGLLPFLGQVYQGGSHDIRQVATRSVVWDLRGLSDLQIGFFLDGYQLWVCMVRPISPSPSLNLLEVFDEFTRIVSIERARRAGTSELFMLDTVRTCRKRGIGIMWASQTPHMLPGQVSANTNLFIALRPSDGASRDAITRNIALNREQSDFIMGMRAQNPRQAVIRVPGISDPFLVELPEVQLPVANNQEIEHRVHETQDWLDSIFVPPPDRKQPLPSYDTQQDLQSKPRAATVDKSLPVNQDHELTKKQIDYLADANDNITTPEPVTKRDKTRGLTNYQGNQIRNTLAKKGLIHLHTLSLGGRGKQCKMIEITPEGYRVLKQLGVKTNHLPGRGGFIHRFGQRIILDWCARQGYSAKIEEEREGSRVDVSVKVDNKCVAFELVCEGLHKELSNAAKDFAAGWDEVTFVAMEKGKLKALEKMVSKELADVIDLNKVRFKPLSDFVKDKENSDE